MTDRIRRGRIPASRGGCPPGGEPEAKRPTEIGWTKDEGGRSGRPTHEDDPRPADRGGRSQGLSGLGEDGAGGGGGGVSNAIRALASR
jgi:hypothetical protein